MGEAAAKGPYTVEGFMIGLHGNQDVSAHGLTKPDDLLGRDWG
jgi:hypothetical protein